MDVLGLTLLILIVAGLLWLWFGRTARRKRTIASEAARRAVERQFESDEPDNRGEPEER